MWCIRIHLFMLLLPTKWIRVQELCLCLAYRIRGQPHARYKWILDGQVTWNSIGMDLWSHMSQPVWRRNQGICGFWPIPSLMKPTNRREWAITPQAASVAARGSERAMRCVGLLMFCWFCWDGVLAFTALSDAKTSLSRIPENLLTDYQRDAWYLLRFFVQCKLYWCTLFFHVKSFFPFVHQLVPNSQAVQTRKIWLSCSKQPVWSFWAAAGSPKVPAVAPIRSALRAQRSRASNELHPYVDQVLGPPKSTQCFCFVTVFLLDQILGQPFWGPVMPGHHWCCFFESWQFVGLPSANCQPKIPLLGCASFKYLK